jgi:hypothetical protein
MSFSVFERIRIPRYEYRPYQSSGLYHLAPIAVGTVRVESLSSYVARLAEAHRISVAVLFGYELLPVINNAYVRSLTQRKNKAMLLASTYQTLVRALNGAGKTAEQWVEALEQLTLRRELGLLTMSPWKNVLPHKALTRSVKAWCPQCFEDARINGQVIYEQLSWSLQAVTACVRHRCRLVFECPWCGRNNPVLTSRSRTGFCSTCLRWLGRLEEEKSTAIFEEELSWQIWVQSELDRIFLAAQQLSMPPARERVSESISNCIERQAGGNNAEMGRLHGIPRSKLNLWRNGDTLPELGALLRFCHAAKLSLLEAITGAVVHDVQRTESQPVPAASGRVKTPRTWSRLDQEMTKKALEEATTISPPPSLKSLALELGRTPNTLRYQFPKLCALIVKRFRKFSKSLKQKFYQQIKRALTQALRSVAPAPTLEDLVRRFKCHRSVFFSNFPELCHKLMRRNEEDRKDRLAEIEGLLRFAATEETPPRSLKAFCEWTGCSDQSLRENFPELCALISSRYRLHLKEKFRTGREEQSRLVKVVSNRLYAEGIYPSVRNVQSCISSFSVRSSKVALASLREVRSELGLITTYV